MKRFNNFRRMLLPVAALAATIGLTLGGCTKVDDTLGGNLIPDNQQMRAGYVQLPRADELYEIRLQYGKLTKDAYDSIVSNISSTYGDATYLRTLSNGSIEKWWNTKTVRLTAYYQESGVNVYIRKK